VESRLKEVMAAVLEVDESELGDDASVDTISTWDSLHHMNLVLALEDEFGIRFPDEEVANLTSLRVLRDALSSLTTG
jgi:acyl carrier protein